MFYNVENLFDTEDDYSTDDEEYLPGGPRGWTIGKYFDKLNSIFQSIAAAGAWTPPEIVGFAEIENRKVLEDLIAKTNLSGFNYGILHSSSPDPRGIDVGLIFRKDVVNIIESHSLIPTGKSEQEFRSRSVLFVKCTLMSDTLHLFINHWPSRLGGVLKRESLRSDIAEMIRIKTDSVSISTGNRAKIIIMGDFNCEWSDKEMRILTGADGGYGTNLVNLSIKAARSGKGTYKYQGKWELLDQIIVSGSLLSCSKGLCTSEDLFKIIDNAFLMRDDEKYPGKTTFSTYYGYKYIAGFSDHLPVTIELITK